VIELPVLAQHGCGLDAAGLAAQLDRARRLGGRVTRDGDVFAVAFAEGIDATLVNEFLSAERACCSFLTLDYDEEARVLRLGAHDEDGRAVAAQLAAAFAGEGSG
jgi:hypothetical protein